MICLSSAAVVRLARAKADMDKAKDALNVYDDAAMCIYAQTHYEFNHAARAVADEAIAMGHHLREGD